MKKSKKYAVKHEVYSEVLAILEEKMNPESNCDLSWIASRAQKAEDEYDILSAEEKENSKLLIEGAKDDRKEIELRIAAYEQIYNLVLEYLKDC